MTKSVASEPNAEFKKNDENQRVNEATAPETNVASDVASDGVAADGPTVTIKGVSGKKITGVVKVVKAKAKKEAPGQDEQQDTDATESDPRTADKRVAPKKVNESRVKTGEAATASEEAKPAAVVEEPVAKPEKKQGEPGKVGNIFEMRKAAAQKEKVAQDSQTKPTATAGTRRPTDMARGERPSGARSDRAGAATSTQRRGPVADGQKAPARKQGTPGKVGNIFDSTGGAAQSSLAATVEMHAQRVANRNKRQADGARSGDQQQRDGRGYQGQRSGPGRTGRSYGGSAGAQTASGNRYDSRPARAGSAFPDKDKDEDQPKFQSRPRKQTKRPMDLPPAEMVAGARGRGSAKRGARGDSGRRAPDRETGTGSRRRGSAPQRDSYFDSRRGRRGRQKVKPSQPQTPRAVLTHVSLPEQITVKEFAEALKKTTSDIIKALMKYGVMATINQVIDYDTATVIAGEFDITTEQVVEVTEEDILFDESEDDEATLENRPPIVVVMGHVDHGKTSLLDYYRKSSVVTGEAGGITQHIGAYMVRVNDRKVTFLDTPGHEAFTTMRARGAKVTDIAILVVAADDGVMPQTIEAINHAKAAETEVIVAINKIDKAGANVDRIKQELATHGLIPEDWGGTTVVVPVSAKTGEGMEELLEMVLLTADVLDLKANPDRQAKGTVIEAKLDRTRGPVATLLVQRGTLHATETIVTGTIVGNVRVMLDANGKPIKKAGPSVPVEITGLPDVPEAGEIFYGVDDERLAKQLAERRRVQIRESGMKASSRMSLDTLYAQMAEGEVKDLNIIVKADVQGSVEAVIQSLERLSNENVKVTVIHGAVGAVTESDIRLAEVSNAIVIGFNVRPGANVEDMAKESGVDIRLYRVIYNAIEDIEAAMKGMLDPEFEEVHLGTVELRDVFKISSSGIVGGGYVLDGKITRSAQVRVVRDGIVVAEDKVASLRRFKDDVREVSEGYECGVILEKFRDLKVDDKIEAFEMREIERE